jgi:hypothetical protein
MALLDLRMRLREERQGVPSQDGGLERKTTPFFPKITAPGKR